MKRSRVLSRWLMLVALAILLAGCAAPQESVQPAPEPTQPPESAAQPTAAPTVPVAPPTAAPTAIPAIPESRRLVLEWPPVMRAGDGEIIRLTLEMSPGGEVIATAEVEGHETSTQLVEIPNLYATHQVWADTRLDMAGVDVMPPDKASQPLLPGLPVTFFWSVSPENENTYRGTVWLWLRFIPKDGSGPESQSLVSAQQIEIRATNFLGLSGSLARVAGVVGTLAGSVLSLDNVLPWAWRKLKARRKP